MFGKVLTRCFLTVVVSVSATAMVQATVTIDWKPVGNPGNSGEWSGESYGGFGPDAIVGGVGYNYNIGKYEITAAQYCEFLNAVADEDTYGLYNTEMWSSSRGCKIEQTGSSPNYSYSVTSEWANRPVNYVSWGDAARFCNWLHNEQPTGAQDDSTTEDGAYDLNGATSNSALMAVVREADAKRWIPSENEWYKAAYHKNDGVTGNYFDYPISSDSLPSNDLIDPDPGNNATYYIFEGDFTIDSPYWRTEFGAHENSGSPYETFDQGGNVWEWNETPMTIETDDMRGVRGGNFLIPSSSLAASHRDHALPADEFYTKGFRVASVPEPSTFILLGIGALGLLAYTWRRRKMRG